MAHCQNYEVCTRVPRPQQSTSHREPVCEGQALSQGSAEHSKLRQRVKAVFAMSLKLFLSATVLKYHLSILVLAEGAACNADGKPDLASVKPVVDGSTEGLTGHACGVQCAS